MGLYQRWDLIKNVNLDHFIYYESGYLLEYLIMGTLYYTENGKFNNNK